MRKIYLLAKVLFVTFFISSLSLAQEIPNNSFENWNGGDPVGWWTNDILGIFDAVTQTSDSWQGSSAALMTVLDGGGGFALVPLLAIGDIGSGTPVSQRYGSFKGYYKFNPAADENFNVAVLMLTSTNLVGAGVAAFPAASNWTEFNVPIEYLSGETPDLAILQMSVMDSNSTGTVGTWVIVDYVTFGTPTDVEQINGLPENYSLKQNYPNPFNPSTNIEYSIPSESFVELKVYDVLGNEVASLVNEQQQAGVYRADFIADNLPSGMYFARLTANEFTQVVKMILLK